MNKTGATRYQKFLKAEKSKTKLKGKKDKELPKGTNVTKTNFKIKKIIIREQLKKHDQTDVLTNRKLSVKELLSRLNHFNTNARVDALNGLREIILSHPEVLQKNLGQLLNGVTSLILNIEKSVRQVALKVLHLILSNISQEAIEPFFDIMSTYLRNAMTHIDNRIQEDSLLFLDILLLCTPIQISQDFKRIIPNFLDMISKLKMDQPGRALTVNLNSQITSMKWRIKVFQRLRDLVQKYAVHNKIENYNNATCVNVHTFNKTNSLTYYSLFDSSVVDNCYISCFSTKSSNIYTICDDIEKFMEYVDILFPLLFETWIEVAPNKKSETNFETVVNEDCAVLLQHILAIISLTWSFVRHFNKKSPGLNVLNVFCQKYKQLFSEHFLNSFPYVTILRSRSNNEENVIVDSKLVKENLEICQLYINFNPLLNKKHNSKEISSILNYIENKFSYKKEVDTENAIVSILHSLFSTESVGWSNTLTILEPLFKQIIATYFNEDISNSLKEKIFHLLCKVALNDKLSHFHSTESYGVWLKNLPDILLKESINVDTVNIIHKFAVTNNKVFNLVLKPKLLDVIQNLPKIKIINTSDDSVYQKLLSILYWIKVWDTESFNCLENQLMSNEYKCKNGQFVINTLQLKSGLM